MLFWAVNSRADLAPLRPKATRLACSFRHPVCVSVTEHTKGSAPLEVLASADRMWDLAVGALDLPAPDADDATGAYDIYLAPNVEGGTRTYPARRDPIARFDRSSAFTLLDASLRGAALDHAVARSIFHAIAFRLSPGTDRTTMESEAVSLADLAVPAAHVHDIYFETRPDLAISDPLPDAPVLAWPFADGASFFYSWLDQTYANQPGSFVRAIWALTPTQSPVSSPSFGTEPDVFDVLRMTFRPTNGGLDFGQFMLDFAIARATDPNENARHEWDIDWPASPRALAPAFPIAPTGSSYVLVRRRGAGPGSKLRVEATWEEHASLRWVAIKLDANGVETARIPISGQTKQTQTQITIDDLDKTAAVLLIAVNLGDDAAPFEPETPVQEPHGWLLRLSAE